MMVFSQLKTTKSDLRHVQLTPYARRIDIFYY